jgi:hypothetical protein
MHIYAFESRDQFASAPSRQVTRPDNKQWTFRTQNLLDFGGVIKAVVRDLTVGDAETTQELMLLGWFQLPDLSYDFSRRHSGHRCIKHFTDVFHRW